MNAGGRATASGIDFQAEVTAWLAAHMLSERPLGERFGLADSETIVSLRCETGADMDDIAATLSGGGVLKVQCKTTLSVSDKPSSEFAKTISQLVAAFSGTPEMDPHTNALVIAVSGDASKSLDQLAEAWADVATGDDDAVARLTNSKAEYFGKFRTLAQAAADRDGSGLDLVRLSALARLFRLDTSSGKDPLTAGQMLGLSLYGSEAAGTPAYRNLVDLCMEAIKYGRSLTRETLLVALRKRGHRDKFLSEARSGKGRYQKIYLGVPITAVIALILFLLFRPAPTEHPPHPSPVVSGTPNSGSPPAPDVQKLAIGIANSFPRDKAISELEQILEPEFEADDTAIGESWQKQAQRAANKHPAAFIAHFHMLRDWDRNSGLTDAEKLTRDQHAEEQLFTGLVELDAATPKIPLILYSSSFGRRPLRASCAALETAGLRAARAGIGTEDGNLAIIRRVRLLAWSEAKTHDDTDKSRMLGLVRSLAGKPQSPGAKGQLPIAPVPPSCDSPKNGNH